MSARSWPCPAAATPPGAPRGAAPPPLSSRLLPPPASDPGSPCFPSLLPTLCFDEPQVKRTESVKPLGSWCWAGMAQRGPGMGPVGLDQQTVLGMQLLTSPSRPPVFTASSHCVRPPSPSLFPTLATLPIPRRWRCTGRSWTGPRHCHPLPPLRLAVHPLRASTPCCPSAPCD